jgi:hypothetical protein
MIRVASVIGAAAVSVMMLCATAGATSAHRSPVPASVLRAYVAQVEKVRLPVDALLEGTDPIIEAFNDHQLTPAQASLEMNNLEERFAGYVLAMQEIMPPNTALVRANKPYAYTYYLEDNYLSTLASDLNEGDFDNLPNTQDQQRLDIIVWRTQMELLARGDGVKLPADIQQAGRGEIAPSPSGS